MVKHTIESTFDGGAPKAMNKKDMVKRITKVVNRPILLPAVTSFVVKLVLGEMSALVLESQRVSSKKIEDLGFNFKYYHLQPALEDVL